jgi:hypothetical protein
MKATLLAIGTLSGPVSEAQAKRWILSSICSPWPGAGSRSPPVVQIIALRPPRLPEIVSATIIALVIFSWENGKKGK